MQINYIQCRHPFKEKKAKEMLENTCHGKPFRKELIIYIGLVAKSMDQYLFFSF